LTIRGIAASNRILHSCRDFCRIVSWDFSLIMENIISIFSLKNRFRCFGIEIKNQSLW
jgi:hypothetical protein